MTVCAPLRAARFAASTFVSMPPFDIALPVPPAIDSSAASPAVAVGDQRRFRIPARIGREQARLIGEDHEHVRLDQVGDEGAERVVVAELDLVGHDRVVLVDDRNHAERQQGEQRGTRVEVARPVGEVRVSEKDLRGLDSVPSEVRFVRARQAHLADGRGRLKFMDLLRTLRPAEPLHAFGDRSARDQQHLLAEFPQPGHLGGPARDRLEVEAAAVVGHEAAADLHDDTPRRRDHRSHASCSGEPARRLLRDAACARLAARPGRKRAISAASSRQPSPVAAEIANTRALRSQPSPEVGDQRLALVVRRPGRSCSAPASAASCRAVRRTCAARRRSPGRRARGRCRRPACSRRDAAAGRCGSGAAGTGGPARRPRRHPRSVPGCRRSRSSARDRRERPRGWGARS